MVWGMLRPDLFGAFATHAGDALWEVSALPSFPAAAQALRNEYDGSFEAFWADFRSRAPFTKKSDPVLLEAYTCAAAYSPTPDGGIELPFRLDTGEVVHFELFEGTHRNTTWRYPLSLAFLAERLAS